MNIYAIGTSHRHSPVEVREGVVFAEEEMPNALRSLQEELAAEAVILSTCNRTEIYVVPRNDYFSSDRLKEWLRRWKKTEIPNEHLFAFHSGTAVHHLFEVAAGIDSQVIGDIQIIGQVKQAFRVAQQNGSVGKLLSRLFTTALRTGKRVKSETELFSGAVSVSYVAVELAKKIFYPLQNQRTLVVGAGETGELTARNLRSQGVRDITITNRTEERGRRLIEELGFGHWMPLKDLAPRLHEFDIVIVSAGAPDYLITYKDVRASVSGRSGEPQLIVDISVPRNVDPRVASVSGVFCKDLNDLNNVIQENVERRRSELPRAEAIIADEMAEFAAWCRLLPVTPIIAQLKRQSEQIAQAELEKNRHRFAEAEFAHIEKLVGSVVKKIIGIPMAHLLEAEADREHLMLKAEYVRILFNLDATEADDVPNGNGTSAHETTNGTAPTVADPKVPANGSTPTGITQGRANA